MNRLFAAAAVAACLFAFGCAGASGTTEKVDPETVNNDYVECENRAIRATAVLTDQDDAETRREALIDECMKLKGYDVHD